MPHKPVIAIDGPAASGKGTLARRLALDFHFAYLDTGALYRAVALVCDNHGLQTADQDDALAGAKRLKEILGQAESPSDILDNPDLRNDDIGRKASHVAAQPAVRMALLDIQQSFAREPGIQYAGAILDGRDIGTVIAPDADIKLFITARDEVRAERRLKELQSKGISASYEAVLKDLRARDAKDTGRKDAPLKAADDAIKLDTSDLTQDGVFEKARGIIRRKLADS